MYSSMCRHYRMDGDSTGGGAEENKPATRTISSRLSAIYENLLAKKNKDKTAVPVDEEAGNINKVNSKIKMESY